MLRYFGGFRVLGSFGFWAFRVTCLFAVSFVGGFGLDLGILVVVICVGCYNANCVVLC